MWRLVLPPLPHFFPSLSRDYFERSENLLSGPCPSSSSSARSSARTSARRRGRCSISGSPRCGWSAPRDGWPNPSAGPAAAGADAVLEQASVHATLAEAVADCSTRLRDDRPQARRDQASAHPRASRAGNPLASPAARRWCSAPNARGSKPTTLRLARAIVTVPINPEFGSLNLAQAVILCAYEWSKQTGLAQPTVEELLPPAPQDELEGHDRPVRGPARTRAATSARPAAPLRRGGPCAPC